MSNPGNPTTPSAPTGAALQQGIGGKDDSVKLVINKDAIVIATKWSIRESILQQPATFSITLGSGDLASSILARYGTGPQYECQLYVGGALQQSGYVDCIEANQSRGGATEIVIKGRDSMAPLQDAYVDGVIAANVSTYAQLIWFVLQRLNLAPSGPIDPTYLQLSNDANRNIKSGVSVGVLHELYTVQQILQNNVPGNPPGSQVVITSPQAKLHETWHAFLRRHLDRAGLFLWAAADGSFVLSAPNGQQKPTYLLRRKKGEPVGQLRGNVVAMNYRDDRTYRHTECVVYGKGGGKSFGRVKSKGSFQDQEMLDSGYDQPIVFRDSNCHNEAEAEFFARRKLAEERRAGWMLEYTVDGHTLPLVQVQGGASNGAKRAVLVADTVIQVDDDELGLSGSYYLEGVERTRGPETLTKLRLMRIGDLIFGSDE